MVRPLQLRCSPGFDGGREGNTDPRGGVLVGVPSRGRGVACTPSVQDVHCNTRRYRRQAQNHNMWWYLRVLDHNMLWWRRTTCGQPVDSVWTACGRRRGRRGRRIGALRAALGAALLCEREIDAQHEVALERG